MFFWICISVILLRPKKLLYFHMHAKVIHPTFSVVVFAFFKCAYVLFFSFTLLSSPFLFSTYVQVESSFSAVLTFFSFFCRFYSVAVPPFYLSFRSPISPGFWH
jgi:hypothetical protein